MIHMQNRFCASVTHPFGCGNVCTLHREQLMLLYLAKNLNSYKIIIHAISLKCTNAPEQATGRDRSRERASELCVAPGFFTWPVHLKNHCRPHTPTHSNQIGQAPSLYVFHNLLHRPNVKQQQGIFFPFASFNVCVCVSLSQCGVTVTLLVECVSDAIGLSASYRYTNYKPLDSLSLSSPTRIPSSSRCFVCFLPLASLFCVCKRLDL